MNDIKFDGIIPPVIFESPNGRWAVSGSTWVTINNDVTLEEVRSWWKKPEKKEFKLEGPQSWNVKSSRSDKMYLISYDSGNWSCDCARFAFKRKCKHIDKIKLINYI